MSKLVGVVICLLLLSAISDSRPNGPGSPPSPPVDPRQQLSDACASDITSHCSAEQGMEWQLFCLYAIPKDTLSDSCEEYLGSTTLGGCNNEAQTLCKDKTQVDEIMLCLQENKDKLSTDCLRNIEENVSSKSQIRMLEEQIRKSTQRVTRLGIIFLLAPLFAAGYALWWMFRVLKDEEDVVLGESVSAWKSQSLFESSTTAEEELRPWSLSFKDISFWIVEKSPITESFATRRKQILFDISAQIKAEQMTAIMGPSGSGKTTLLKLLSGRMFSGEYSGQRAVNREVLTRPEYDEAMRRQGFVPQHDNMLSSLTVWQTLKYAALLRLPEEISLRQKLYHAAHVMESVGLSHIAHSVIGSTGGTSMDGDRSDSKCISGGQRRRLSIALEMLTRPSVMLLDEPTSGLDGASTLQIVRTLQSLCRCYRTTVCLTIHQPRAEVFELFDQLLLLGSGGRLVYYGPTRDASRILSSAPHLSGRLFTYENPGDFVIDLLNLNERVSDGGVSDLDSSSEQSPTNTHLLANHYTQSIEFTESENVLQSIFSRTLDSQTDESRGMMRQMSSRLKTLLLDCNLWWDNTRSEVSYNRLPTESTHTGDIELSDLVVPPNASEESSPAASLQSVHNVQSTATAAVTVESTSSDSSLSHRQKNYDRTFPLYRRSQIIVLFGRRILAFRPGLMDITWLCLQMILVALVVTVAFSYEVSTELEMPYQVLMVISLISLYAMILQYLLLTPEYLVERQIVIDDVMAGNMSGLSYLISVALTEIPRAVLQCGLLWSILYAMHELNPDVVKIRFSFVCLIIGVCSWQSLIAVCSVVTDSIGVAYSIAFLVMSTGALFGGLLVRLQKIPGLFKCCYMTITCNSIAHDFQQMNVQSASLLNHANSSTTFCPPGLEFTGDGSDIGNLGRFYLMGLGLDEDHPFISLLFLMITCIVFRLAAVWILNWRVASKDRLIRVPIHSDPS